MPVDGLRPGLLNRANGAEYPINHRRQTWLSKEEDPDHSSNAVDAQINGGRMDGFAQNFAAARGRDPAIVMGYQTAEEVPVFDHLATEFCVCDRWFSSIPGATWPNRLYSVTGGAEGSRDNWELPLYDRPSIMRHLDRRRRHPVRWRWYSFDPGTLRLIDGHYRLFHDDNFAAFERRSPLDKKELLRRCSGRGSDLPARGLDQSQLRRLQPVLRTAGLKRRSSPVRSPLRPGAAVASV